ncbi:reverse transcriptase domain-containing protein [Klebsiella pneumoniae]|uniref:reverse transcriptase domain-containing protein n=1 Tax=Klebsiella pneumoniae TaxID=573 RepID=UPI00405586F8
MRLVVNGRRKTPPNSSHANATGVPQGSVLGPLLFNIYTAHIVGATYPHCEVAAYADDIGIYSTSLNSAKALRTAEGASQLIADRLRAVNIRVNPTKTQGIVFSFQTG